MATVVSTESKASELQRTAPGSQDQEPSGQPIPLRLNQNATVPMSRKIRKNRKTVAGRGPVALPKNRGTGFEEYFADPPLTPAEALEEKNEIYNRDFPLVQRMQNCINRFRSRRRIQADGIVFFNEYLFLGGVDCYPSQYSGLGRQDLSDLTPAQKREATATDMIYGTSAAGDKFYDGDKEKWIVDFAGVVAGYLSVTLVELTGCEWNKMYKAVGIVENFLKYVLHHDVCPEYKLNIERALEYCESSKIEWPMLRRIYQLLPGQFNLAAIELFCTDDPDENWCLQPFGQLKGLDARMVFYSSVALMYDADDLWQKIMKQTPTIVRGFECTLKLLCLQKPSEEVCDRFKAMTINDKNANLIPIGKATFAPSTIEDEWETPAHPCPIRTDMIDLYLDDVILDELRPGMKMRATLCELDVGIHFIKSIDTIVPSFYRFLPQELMKHYKSPRENEWPAPSIHDPDAEDKQNTNAAREG